MSPLLIKMMRADGDCAICGCSSGHFPSCIFYNKG